MPVANAEGQGPNILALLVDRRQVPLKPVAEQGDGPLVTAVKAEIPHRRVEILDRDG